jgi:O-antigen ligase
VSVLTLGGRWAERILRRLPQVSWSVGMVTVLALVLLYVCFQAVLASRSLKYLLAMVVAGALGVFFLVLPRKFIFLQFMLGFSMPFYVQVILMDRDEGIMSLTGMMLIAIALAVVGTATGATGDARILLEPRVLLPGVGFLCAGCLSFINTSDQTLTFIAILKQTEMLLLFLILVNFVRREEDLVWYLRGLYLGFIIECGIYVLQNMLGFSFDLVGNRRWTGKTDLDSGHIGSQRGTFATSATMAALYFSVVSLSLVGMFLSRRKLPIRLNPLVGAVCGVVCLILAAKRAPLGSFVLGIGTIGMLCWKFAPQVRTRLFKIMAGLMFPILLGLPVLLLRAEANHEADYEERMNLTKVAWSMFEANPVVGVGFGTYDSVKRAYLPPGWTGWLSTVHNRYLSTMAETGIVGITFFLLMMVMILVAAYRGIFEVQSAYRPFQISLVAGVVAMCWEMAWDIFLDRQHEYLLWTIAALAVIVPRALPLERPAAEGS